ncbi:hypothetical protein LSH36_466g01020 [Paralvinella palmiformis]|uniref:RNA-binding protein Luc7-like 2 n=1 Tax=Paralvinella palmiformis TaxID=53620 RepID=A0AAD9JBA5_9ANNE|nr:hypothetical protein LSH36_466g01020 [Paralvinella palmiformis]
MTAQDQMRAMLDQLMGTSRDGDPDRCKVRFYDPRVCKSFLLGCCPHEILSSTRMDLGECPKIHDLALKADYELAAKTKDYYYDIDALDHLETFIAECDRKTELAKRRLKETQEELSEEASGKAEVIHALGEQIGTRLAKAEELGAEGNVEESLKFMEEVEELKKKKAAAEIEYRNSMPASSYQQQKLRVCEVCSAYLGIHDNDRRLADHFGGKLHLGFIEIRDHLKELKKVVESRLQQREKEREERRKQRELRGSSVGKKRSRSRSRSRRSHSRGKRSRSRDRHRRRSRSRSHSKERRKRRSRSVSRSRHSRHRRSRSHSRRSKSRSRRSRSRSRSRRKRSRSRSPSRRKSRHSRSRSRSKRHRSRSYSRHRSHSRSSSQSADHEESADSTNDKIAGLNGETHVPSQPVE